jgi:hypothetical protein
MAPRDALPLSAGASSGNPERLPTCTLHRHSFSRDFARWSASASVKLVIPPCYGCFFNGIYTSFVSILLLSPLKPAPSCGRDIQYGCQARIKAPIAVHIPAPRSMPVKAPRAAAHGQPANRWSAAGEVRRRIGVRLNLSLWGRRLFRRPILSEFVISLPATSLEPVGKFYNR